MGKIFVPQVESIDKLLEEGPSIDELYDAQGRHTKGDGGGGIVKVTDSGAETDGGTVFVFDEDKSQEVTEATTSPPYSYTLSHSDIVWGSFEARYGPDPEDVMGVKHLHGHNSKEEEPSNSRVDFQSGSLGMSNNLINLRKDYGYESSQWDFSYRYATSERRLERVGVGNSVNLAWWGAPKADPNNPQTADPYLKWAINAAAELYQNTSYEWTYVDIPDEYYWLHTTHLRNGVKLRGTGSVISQEWNTKGALTLMPEMALYYNKKSYDPTDPANRDLVHGSREQRKRHTFVNEHQASKVGYQNLRIDGNLENQSLFDNLGDYEDPENKLQNSGTYSGFYSTGKTGQSFPDGMVVDLDDVNITGMGNLTIGLSTGDADFQTSNVNLKDGVRNHVIYSATGTMDDVTVQGQAWGAIAVIGDARTSGTASYTNLTLKNLEDGYYDINTVLQDRVGPVSVDDFSVDMTGLTTAGVPVSIISVSGHGASFKNGTIQGPTQFDQPIELLEQRGTDKTLKDEDVLLENITVTGNGAPIRLHSSGDEQFRRHVFRNITIENANGVSSTNSFPAINYLSRDPDPTKPKSDQIKYENVEQKIPYNGAQMFSVSDRELSGNVGHPLDTFWDQGEINYIGTTDNYWKFVGGTGVGNRRFRAHLYDVTMNSPDVDQWFKSDGWHKHLRPNGIVRLRNCQDNSGRTSDAIGSYTSGASDEGNDYVLIDTNLMSRAFERSATVTSGNRTVQSVEVANSDGSLRTDNNEFQKDPYLRVNLDSAIQAGSTITVDWTARVTPMDRYQTTGLFVTRPWSNQSYTTGNGPWTLDLRGTAASQESREKIVYTASSDSTGVVTANVQSDEYTLEFTEQGTGTATITVDAEIPGVGTAQTTFDVTIS